MGFVIIRIYKKKKVVHELHGLPRISFGGRPMVNLFYIRCFFWG